MTVQAIAVAPSVTAWSAAGVMHYAAGRQAKPSMGWGGKHVRDIAHVRGAGVALRQRTEGLPGVLAGALCHLAGTVRA